MKHFLNTELFAPNVATASVDYDLVREFAPLASITESNADYFVKRPKWGSDIRWISADTEETFARFEDAFERLGIGGQVAQYLDLDRAPRLYAGFIVARSVCSEPYFHADWLKTNNDAFTTLTPINGDSAGFGMLYKKANGQIAEYEYQPGEAIIFGEHFVHSTKPGKSSEPVALLCFQFGTDKMDRWPDILVTAGTQSQLITQPDGRFTKQAIEERRALNLSTGY